jgi:hypothetical protein
MWNHVVIEGVCLKNEAPCGRKHPTAFCLLEGHCPHFGWTESNEREASFWVPLRLILVDRIKELGEKFCQFFVWHFHDKWHLKECEDFINSIPVLKDDDPTAIELRNAQAMRDEKFIEWIKKAKESW